MKKAMMAMALVAAVFGFGFVACSTDTNDNGPLDGVWEGTITTWGETPVPARITCSGNDWTLAGREAPSVDFEDFQKGTLKVEGSIITWTLTQKKSDGVWGPENYTFTGTLSDGGRSFTCYEATFTKQ